jgi:vancomycin resistance protein YoaR
MDNSIIRAQGGQWSFNDVVGESSAATGFLGAGTILDGEIVDDVGGGICQVATTVFNAVYLSGFPIVERHNHSLYLSNYPAGRDAAISYPYLDLRWKNDSNSDVLLTMSYTETSVLAQLYSVNPGYVVSTEIGDWEEGETFSTQTIETEDIEALTSYTKTKGVNGKKISITRTVKDAEGNTLHTQVFSSVYDAIDEVIVVGVEKASKSESLPET